jgi:hypothetical protein
MNNKYDQFGEIKYFEEERLTPLPTYQLIHPSQPNRKKVTIERKKEYKVHVKYKRKQSV